MVLLERELELDAIADAIAAARRGRGSGVLLSGPAGIGKTAVLGAARGGADDVRWLAARGGELERDLALGVTRQLLEPVLLRSARDECARLLTGTGPAAEVLEARQASGPGDSSAVMHGLYRLVTNLAGESPVVLEVDDVQWADAISLRFLAYLTRRIADLPVVLLLARRDGEPASDEAALGAIGDEATVREHALGALSVGAVARVMVEIAGEAADESVCRACHAASAGNPFVLRELVGALRERGMFDARGAARVSELGTPAVAKWALRRLGRLPASAGRLARAIAVLGPDADLGRAARLAGLPLGEAEDALDALIEINLLEPGRSLDFVHPIVRAAVHDAMPHGHRSGGHRDAARLLRDQDRPPGAVAMHLLATDPGGERWVVEALLAGAQMALAQGAPEVAAANAQRALDEPAPADLRPAVLRALGNAERRLGSPEADARFLEALESIADPRERARTVMDMIITGGPHPEAMPLVRETMLEVESLDPELARILRARFLMGRTYSDEPVEADIRAGHSLLAGHEQDTLGTRLLAGALAFDAAQRAEPRPAVLALAMRAVSDDASYVADLDAGYPHIYALMALRVVDEPALAERRLTHAAEEALRRGSLVGAGIALFQRARIRSRTGRLAAAEEDSRHALAQAAQTSARWLVAASAAALVEALTERGDTDAGEAVLDEHALAGPLPPVPPFADLNLTRSLLRLSAGRAEDAYADAIAVRPVAERLGTRNPLLLGWRSPAALALVALGRPEEARVLAEEDLAIAEAAQLPTAIGGARRVLALATGGGAAVSLLREAVADLESEPAPLELTRALVDLGAALRRSGRRKDAREPLARALELAHLHGSRPLAELARAELLASGARPRREVRTGLEALTTSERRVAELAAAGLSNPEITARLFITRKTVEAHMRSIFVKLDIGSRHELPELLAAADGRATDEGLSSPS